MNGYEIIARLKFCTNEEQLIIIADEIANFKKVLIFFFSGKNKVLKKHNILLNHLL